MQRLWSMAKSLWLASMSTVGLMTRQLEVGDPERLGQVLELAVAVGDADGADMVALGEQQLDDRPGDTP